MRVSVVWSKLATCHLRNLPIDCPDHCPRASSQLRSLAQFLLFPTLLATGLSCVLGCAGRASPSPAQLLAFAPGKEQAAGVWEP